MNSTAFFLKKNEIKGSETQTPELRVHKSGRQNTRNIRKQVKVQKGRNSFKDMKSWAQGMALVNYQRNTLNQGCTSME